MIKGVLDAGHYGRYNQGIIKTYWESESNLSFAQELKKELESTGEFLITMTREDLSNPSLSARGKMAQNHDFFLSIHSDSAGSSTGSLVIDSVDLETEKFAAKLTQACADGYGLKTKAVREREYKNTGEDYYTVIDKAQDIGCPLVHLLERGNHSNKVDCARMMDPYLQTRAVKLIAKVYMDHYGVKPKPTNEVSDWALDGQAFVINKGISDGKRPKDLCSREEQWVMLHRLYNTITKELKG